MKSPLNYLGGKSRLASTIVPLLPPHICYVEPFCGAAWILFSKEPSKVEVINDADGELVNFWRVIQNHLQPFLDYFKFAVISRKVFDLESAKRPDTLTDIQRAVRYFYLQKLAFGGKTEGRTFGPCVTRGPGLNLTNVEERLLEVHWRLERVVIENLDACRCIALYDRPETLFYVDPPYFGTAGYSHQFGTDDYARLVDVLSAIEGRFIVSINDVPETRKMFTGFDMKAVSVKYCVAQGDTFRSTPRGELLITNIPGGFQGPGKAIATARRRAAKKAAVDSSKC